MKVRQLMYILPKPQSIEEKTGYFIISYQCRILIDPSCDREVFSHAVILQKEIKDRLGYALGVTRGKTENGGIFLNLDSGMKQEEYTLSVAEDGIRISGGSAAGILYGIQTLRQIIAQEGAHLPWLVIRDYPDIANRGYYFDTTRGRIPTLAALKELADKLSYYKINQLQLYIEHSYLFQNLSEVWRDDTPLTSEEILELDAYCRSLHIELVPSLSTFGHLHKLLSTRTYAPLCELPGSDSWPFSFDDRMKHHTIDVTNDRSLKLIKELIDEFLPLFSSNQFNLCADETFDLGKGRAKEAAQQEGTDRIYIRYVKELCEYLLVKGKRPMFWGDIICGFPEAVKELPQETICLNWGYAPNQGEESVKLLHEAGATQYLCPGVGGWNQFIPRMEASYENIRRMCSYAHKYEAEGVLNTDWGDYGHINPPEFSVVGMIYGAAFSWNHKIIERQEINRQIARLEFGDAEEEFTGLISSLAQHIVFEWYHIINYREMETKGRNAEDRQSYLAALDFTGAEEADVFLREGIEKLYQSIVRLPDQVRHQVKAYILAAEGMMIFNRIGVVLRLAEVQSQRPLFEEADTLAQRLENWFYHYKEGWRRNSKESELYRLQDVILWYADRIRELGDR
ncbi:glycoside hydrolase family 20 zincin-like fold domain-containing protein [Anaerotaenia torta]|uniref:glycoside hydrolase family 20 zincin-like fold domain-containing protein n=1 Tax=Anaerotaenia torta TaxID=433293 RepID=UPI003D22F563